MRISEGTYFYPSHLTKGLVGAGIAILAGAVSLSAKQYALKEFMQIGTEKYPNIPTPKIPIEGG